VVGAASLGGEADQTWILEGGRRQSDMNKDLVMTGELGGRHFAKGVILAWLVHTGGSNLKLLETATGLPGKVLSSLLAEMMEEKTVRLDGVIFQQDTGGCTMDKAPCTKPFQAVPRWILCAVLTLITLAITGWVIWAAITGWGL